MANTDNTCAHLEVPDEFSKSNNTFYDLMSLQKDIQENVYGYNFEQMQAGSLEDMRKFFDWNYHAIQDELREVFQALGGSRDGIGSGVWKPWKSTYKKTGEMKFSEMTPNDLKELKMELIDAQHFLFNMMLAIGMTPEETYNYYFSKNAENRDRQKRGY